MNTLLEQINETLQQLNEVTDLRVNNQANQLQSLTKIMDDGNLETKLGLEQIGLKELAQKPEHKNWNVLYLDAVGKRLMLNQSQERKDELNDSQYILKIENAFLGDTSNKRSGYVKLLHNSTEGEQPITVDDLKKGRKWKKLNKKHPDFITNINSIIDGHAMELTSNKEEASVLSLQDVKDFQLAMKAIIKAIKTDKQIDNKWYFDEQTKLISIRLSPGDIGRVQDVITPDFIISLYSYLFTDNLPLADATDAKIKEKYAEHMADEDYQDWVKAVKRTSNLTKTKLNLNATEQLAKLEVGGIEIGSLQSFSTVRKQLVEVLNQWGYDPRNISQKLVNESWLLGAFLGGLCSDLDLHEITTLPKLFGEFRNNYYRLDSKSKEVFGGTSAFAQTMMLKKPKQDFLEFKEHADVEYWSPKHESFLKCKVRSRDEMEQCSNIAFEGVLPEEDSDHSSSGKNLYFLVRRSDTDLLKLKLRKDGSDLNDRTYIPADPDLDNNIFKFEVGDEVAVVYSESRPKATWSLPNLTSGKLTGNFGNNLKKNDSGIPAVQDSITYDLRKLQIIVNDEDLDKAKVESINLGIGSTNTKQADNNQSEDDGSHTLSDSDIKQAMVNWLWSKKPKSLKNEKQVENFVYNVRETSSWEDKKQDVIDEVKNNPDAYTYDKDLKTFSKVNEDSKLQQLLNDLNKTGQTKTDISLGNDAIPGVSITDAAKKQVRSKKYSASQIRERLMDLLNILGKEKNNDPNKVSKEVYSELKQFNREKDLEDILVWINSILARKNK